MFHVEQSNIGGKLKTRSCRTELFHAEQSRAYKTDIGSTWNEFCTRSTFLFHVEHPIVVSSQRFQSAWDIWFAKQASFRPVGAILYSTQNIAEPCST